MNRRNLLASAGAMAGVMGASALLPSSLLEATTASPLPGFNFAGVNHALLNETKSWFIESGNRILKGTHTSSDLVQLANAHVTTTLHLHGLGFDQAAAKWIGLHKPAGMTEAQITKAHSMATGAGLHITEAQIRAMASKMTAAKLNKVVTLIHAGDAVDFHRGVGTIYKRMAANQAALGIGSLETPNARFFTEDDCTYMGWASNYLGIMAIPTAESIGVGLGIAAVAIWVIGAIGGCN